MEFFENIFVYGFLTKAVVAAVFVGIICGIVGTYMVIRRLIFFAGGVTHSAFGGLGVAYFLGVNPLWGSLCAGILSAFAVEKMSRHGEVREDSAIGILWSVGMAIGIIFIMLTPGYAPNLMNFLFGNILLVNFLDIVLLMALLVIIVLLFVFYGKMILYVALDSEFAKSQHINVPLINNLMLVVLSLTIILSIKVVGIMLLLSLLTIPSSIGGMLKLNYKKMMFFSLVLSVLSLLAGIWISYSVNIPSSAVTVVVMILAMILAKGYKKIAKGRG